MAMARTLRDSMATHGWPPLALISDSPDAEWNGERITVDRGGLPASWIKAFFWTLADGPCWLIDCDCVATGPFVAPEMSSDCIYGRYLHPPIQGAGTGSAFLASTLLGFGSAQVAVSVGQKWVELLAKETPGQSDEHALFRASVNTPKINLGGSYLNPLPNLTHHGVSSRHLPQNVSA